jgi:hypothetical protein
LRRNPLTNARQGDKPEDFTTPGAVPLLGQVAEARCAQVVNPRYTYVTKIAKRYL